MVEPLKSHVFGDADGRIFCEVGGNEKEIFGYFGGLEVVEKILENFGKAGIFLLV